jgi:hypothetical protein
VSRRFQGGCKDILIYDRCARHFETLRDTSRHFEMDMRHNWEREGGRGGGREGRWICGKIHVYLADLRVDMRVENVICFKEGAL